MAGRTQGFRIGAVRAGWLWQRICGALCRQPAGNATLQGHKKARQLFGAARLGENFESRLRLAAQLFEQPRPDQLVAGHG